MVDSLRPLVEVDVVRRQDGTARMALDIVTRGRWVDDGHLVELPSEGAERLDGGKWEVALRKA